MRALVFYAVSLAALSGCVGINTFLRPRDGQGKPPIASIKARFASKKIIAVVYESTAGKTGKRENVFQFEQSVAIDKAFINLRFPVMERSMIQSVLESQKLPESGSFKQEDIEKIAKQSAADILLIGFISSTPRPSMLNSGKRDTSTLLRAIDLKTFEVINTVQADISGPDVWRRLAPDLMLLNEDD